MNPDPLQHALIMGASSGIGLAMAQQLSHDSALKTLVLCSRHASGSVALQTIASAGRASGKTVFIMDVDISDENSLAHLAAALQAQVPVLDLVMNTVGLLHDADLSPEKTVLQISAASMQRVFAVNTFGPMFLAKALWPWLRSRHPVVFASLSARVGSISDNRLGGWYSYRASKAAQNQLLKTMAIELARSNPESIVLALHPGTTDTPLSRPFQSGVTAEKLFTPVFVATRLLQLIHDARPAQSGCFLAWDGQQIEW